MEETSRTRLPNDPLHPDHEMHQRILTGMQAVGSWNTEQAANLAAALYAELRGRQPQMLARDIGQVLIGDPDAARPSVFVVPRAGYHSHESDPAALRFGVPVEARWRPAHESLASYSRDISIGADGFLMDRGVVHTPISRIQHGVMEQVNGIVLHRTESSTASGTLQAWRTGAGGTGAHFLIDKDGTIHQSVSVDQQAWHVGAIRSRGEVEGTITPADQRELRSARTGQAEWKAPAARAVGRVEASRPYPERYPTNADSVGIEVVGRYDPSTRTWDAPTAEQSASIRQLVGILQHNFGLNDHDVYEHDAISRKTPGEGAGLYAPAAPGPAADAVGMPAAGQSR
ncbi:peptidoglycan recognition family protein [Stenotrophomonas sp. YIM B06876]|uniref:peptidoglycan recognition protein family protein n=1 Tax=Stenotrophomonas sp. YIM B06876 TaxID=3060211 RepID=UPI002739BF36|nr:peptidoglycan recognition family protein [Stenotrophomonas sp. YIM B06876]